MTDLLHMIKAGDQEWTNRYLLEITFNCDVLGTQPKTKDVMEKFLMAKLNREAKDCKKKGIAPPSEERIQELLTLHLIRMFGADSVGETLEDETERAHTSFFRYDSSGEEVGPYLGVHMVKACIRDMCTTQGILIPKSGQKQTYQHLMNVKACDERGNILPGEKGICLNFYRDGEVLMEVDSFVEKTGTVMTQQGPRSIIKRHDQIIKATCRFVVSVPANLPAFRKKAAIRDSQIARIFHGAQENALGCSRGQGHGTFVVTKFSRLTNNPFVVGEDPPDKEEKKTSTKRRKRSPATASA